MWDRVNLDNEILGRISRARRQRMATKRNYKVTLRKERKKDDWRDLQAYINPKGDLVLEGHDMGKTVKKTLGAR